VEDAECLEFLRAAGCDMIQGYHISRPLPLDALLTFIATPVAAAA
jgi:EAL domain-containing protein (putative c-di-GMP-specific phosphodiesterase class I)